MPQINFYRLIARPKAESPKAHKIKQYNGYFACYADEPSPFVTAMKVLDHDAKAELLSMRLEETGDIDDVLCHGGSRGRFDEYGPIWIMGVVVEFPKEL